jgi:heat shock protein HslJ
MLCPPHLMEAESRYLRQLGSVVKYGFLGGKLALTYAVDDVTDSMLFTREER